MTGFADITYIMRNVKSDEANAYLKQATLLNWLQPVLLLALTILVSTIGFIGKGVLAEIKELRHDVNQNKIDIAVQTALIQASQREAQ